MATAFNRNIITKGDIARLSKATSGDEVPATLDVNPPAGYAAAAAAPSGGPPVLEYLPPLPPALVPSEDDYLTKLLKYVPLEVLGAYLFVAGVIDSNVTDKRDHALWLGGLLVGILVLTIPYDIRVLNVVRAKQIVVSVIGLSIYVFAVGGWFATTTWYHQWYASIILPVFGLLVAIIKLGDLPTPKDKGN
jgi:hypothetical protein